ncbi:MAG TPA: hydrogenase 4 subunit B [Hyphomicrobiales bacterium]|nr:hydrogenase 4 subunit B [Hyphomicrobiales bacterium]
MVELAAASALCLFLLSVPAVALRPTVRLSATIYALAALPCLSAAGAALAVLTGHGTAPITLPLGLPWIGMHIYLDGLSAVFLLIVAIGGAVTSLYGIGYGQHETAPERVLPLFPAFLGAMMAVVLADDAFTCLIFWELMSLLSWGLVLAHHREGEVRHAAYVYLVMAAFGTMALLLAFGLLAGTDGAYGFETIRTATHSSIAAVVVLALVIIGAGSKAGIAPLHVWLPLAHPAAPSHVSALMSGVMTKVAVYVFIRVVFDLAGPLPWWNSPVLILLGASTAVLGILNAVVADDTKKILAYSTIENIGVIFAALGLALAFRANGMAAASALAFGAAMFHAFNHMAFKSLLFMGAGAVLTATGRRDLDGLGGLINRMPVTSFVVLVGVAAISALPPLNGFASEWLVFQSVLLSPELPQLGLEIIVPAAGGLLALAAALAAAAFVRFYGIIFLGRCRSEAARQAIEVDRWMLGAMGAMAATCLAAGVLPGVVLDLLSPATELVTATQLPSHSAEPWLTLVPVTEARSSYNPLLVLIFIAITSSAAALAVHRFGSRKLRRGPAWDCGFPVASPVAQYGAGSFAQPLRRVLGGWLLMSAETVEMPPPGDARPARHRVVIHDLIWERIYLPLAGAIQHVAVVTNRLQFLTIRQYLSLVMASLVGLLLALALWQ